MEIRLFYFCRYIIVYSGLSPAMHTLVQYGAMEDEMKAFYTYEELLLEWMQNMVFIPF